MSCPGSTKAGEAGAARGACGPYTTTWCYHAPTCHITQPGVTTECPDEEEPPCTDCKQEHRLSVEALQKLMPKNC